MVEYFNSNDLLIRRVQTADWLCKQSKKIVNMVHYGELVSADYKNKLLYVVAAMEAIGCYEPITSEDEDGVNNCLTEAEAEQIFENISKITGLCWQEKGVTYRNQPVEPDCYGIITENVTLTNGDYLCLSNPVNP